MASDWRIDDLAHRAGVTVDTVRYYQRERLLPPPERAGRNKIYGKEHLERLERIRELQHRRFSLAAIRALLEAERPGLVEALFDQGEPPVYSREDLVQHADVAPELLDAIEEIGLLPDPKEFGRNAYDHADLALVRTVGELQRLGMPVDVLTALGSIYVRNFTQMQQEVLEVLATGQGLDWEPNELIAFQTHITAVAGQVLPAVQQVLTYVHQRTLQRDALAAMRRAAVRDAEARSQAEGS